MAPTVTGGTAAVVSTRTLALQCREGVGPSQGLWHRRVGPLCWVWGSTQPGRWGRGLRGLVS